MCILNYANDVTWVLSHDNVMFMLINVNEQHIPINT